MFISTHDDSLLELAGCGRHERNFHTKGLWKASEILPHQHHQKELTFEDSSLAG
jgi:hypothetical protein